MERGSPVTFNSTGAFHSGVFPLQGALGFSISCSRCVFSYQLIIQICCANKPSVISGSVTGKLAWLSVPQKELTRLHPKIFLSIEKQSSICTWQRFYLEFPLFTATSSRPSKTDFERSWCPPGPAVGRGNHWNQSFHMHLYALKRILWMPPTKTSSFQMDLYMLFEHKQQLWQAHRCDTAFVYYWQYWPSPFANDIAKDQDLE